MFVQKLSDLPRPSKLPFLISLDTENKNDSSPEGLSIAWKVGKLTKGIYVPINHRYPIAKKKYCNLPFKDVRNWLEEVVNHSKSIVFHHCGYDLTILETKYKIKVPQVKIEDTMLLHWDLDTERWHGLKEILKSEYKKSVVTYNQAKLLGIDTFVKYGEDDAKGTLDLYLDLMKVAKENPKTYKLYKEHDLAIVPLMQHMNYYDNVVRVNEPLLNSFVVMITKEKELIKQKLSSLLGDINFNSGKQLGVALKKNGYKLQIKEKTGNFILDEKALLKILHTQGGEEIELLMYYRGIEKLDNTYISKIYKLLIEIEPGVFILSGYSFLQHGTRTGRFSSVNPNLQNIPRDVIIMRMLALEQLRKVKKEYRKIDFLDDAMMRMLKEEKVKLPSIDVRAIIIPMPGKVFIGADYSQLELRMMAHISKDPVMIDGYKHGADFHQYTCDGINKRIGKKLIDRSRAKTINFFFQYGGYYKTLARDLNISEEVAKEIDIAYNQLFKVRSKFITDTHKNARKSHFVQTILGRRRNVHALGINEDPDLYETREMRKRAFMRRNNAENACISTIVSGSSADLIKVAMLNIFNKYKKSLNLKLQIHDELLFEVDENRVNKYIKIVKHEMENAMELRVPVIADAKKGFSWREAHG